MIASSRRSCRCMHASSATSRPWVCASRSISARACCSSGSYSGGGAANVLCNGTVRHSQYMYAQHEPVSTLPLGEVAVTSRRCGAAPSCKCFLFVAAAVLEVQLPTLLPPSTGNAQQQSLVPEGGAPRQAPSATQQPQPQQQQ